MVVSEETCTRCTIKSPASPITPKLSVGQGGSGGGSPKVHTRESSQVTGTYVQGICPDLDTAINVVEHNGEVVGPFLAVLPSKIRGPSEVSAS